MEKWKIGATRVVSGEGEEDAIEQFLELFNEYLTTYDGNPFEALRRMINHVEEIKEQQIG